MIQPSLGHLHLTFNQQEALSGSSVVSTRASGSARRGGGRLTSEQYSGRGGRSNCSGTDACRWGPGRGLLPMRWRCSAASGETAERGREEAAAIAGGRGPSGVGSTS